MCDSSMVEVDTEINGKSVTAVVLDDMSLYYCDNTLFLSNGNAYRIGSEYPDYSRRSQKCTDQMI